jgi:hypothetical protein
METKIKQIAAKMKSQASRFKQPPPKLKALIDLVNCFPAEGLKLITLHPHHLRSLAEADVKARFGPDVDVERFLDTHYVGEIMDAIEGLSPLLKNYVLTVGKTGRMTLNEVIAGGGVVTRYLNLWSAHMRLRSIAKLAAEEPNPYRDRSILWRQPVPMPVLDKIDEQGFVRVSKDLFTAAMDEDDVEAARIRECEACERIFWAGRITQKGCSARCGSIIRKRRYRERYGQGFYQGARLTEKEKAALKSKGRSRKAKKGA